MEKCPPAKKSIGCTRSFPVAISELDEIREEMVVYTTRVAERLRQAGLTASAMFLFVETGSHASGPHHVGSTTIKMVYPTDSTQVLLQQALEALERIYKDGHDYRRAGVMLRGLVPADQLTSRFILQ